MNERKKNDFYIKIFRRRRRNDGVENGLNAYIDNSLPGMNFARG